ncbi:U3 snoRNP protein [Oleoguttula sp. CCFEE 5521]
MSAASDRARYYLERSVPELQLFSRLALFSPAEITAIARKRSDFEHVLNSNGSTPRDYIRYATYEMNLDALRKKRCKRLGVKGRARANKKLAKVFTAVLRLRPRDWGMWVRAAKYYAEVQGDMGNARSYLQRGLRFCPEERRLWIEYARLEMGYLGKLAARRRILGLEGREEKAEEDQESEGVIALPEISAEDMQGDEMKGVEEVDVNALVRLKDAPAYTGAIPMAIFDAGMKQFRDDVGFAAEFFELVALYEGVPVAKTVLEHIYGRMHSAGVHSVELVVCEATLHTFSIEVTSAEFPAALSASLGLLKRGTMQLPAAEHAKFGSRAVQYLATCLQHDGELDEAVRQVLEASLARYARLMINGPAGGLKALEELADSLAQSGKTSTAEALRQIANSLTAT